MFRNREFDGENKDPLILEAVGKKENILTIFLPNFFILLSDPVSGHSAKEKQVDKDINCIFPTFLT